MATDQPADAASTTGPGADQVDDNKFQKAITAWRNIDLGTLMPAADNAASDLVAHQRDSLVQRKDLAQKTKDFRKLDDTAKATEVKSLLKAYQTYIDLITNQSKAIHSAFLQIYTPLSEAPDPYPLLEASIDSIATAEEIVPKITQENEQLKGQIAQLTADLEKTEQQLTHERTVRQGLEGDKQDKVKSIEASWNAALAEKQENWDAKEKSLEEKIEHQDRLIKEIKANYEVSQRQGQSEDAAAEANRASATAVELEIVHSELDRANMRLAEVEARNEQLRLELAQSASQANATPTALEDDPAFLRLQSENSSLMRRLESSRMDKESERRKWTEQSRSLDREIHALKSDRDSMRQKLSQWNDYDNVKQELEVLKSIEFATGDDEPDAEIGADVNLSNTNGKKESLEQLLLSRNKKLSSELTLLRVSHQDLQGKLELLQEEFSTANMELEKSRNLAASLESDLETVQQEAANHFPSSAMSVAGTARYPYSSYKSVRGARSTSPTSSIISGFDGRSSIGTLDSLNASEGAGNSILPMITAQRDRFKKKNAELDAEIQKSYQTIQALRSEVASLQKDNLNLYEKTRYVSTISSSTPASNPTTIQIDPPSINAEPAFGRYRSAYEANVNPFSVFRSRESARAFGNMSVPERVIFQLAKLVLATRIRRNLFALYCLGLHVLCLIMLFDGGSAASAPKIGKVKSPAGGVGLGGQDKMA